MADSLVAEFPTQFEASAAVDTLLSLGVARERLALHFEVDAGGGPGRPETPEERAAHRLLRQPPPSDPSTQEALRHTCLLVRLDDPEAAAGLIEILRQAGASSVQRRDVVPATAKFAIRPQSNEHTRAPTAPPRPDSPPRRPPP